MIKPNKLQTYIFDLVFTDQIMKSTLKIKDFGPIKEVDLTLKNVNVFIGPQASGKSVLAKIFTIFKSPRKFLKEIISDDVIESHVYPRETIIEVLKLFNIDTFLTDSTEICFESEVHKISLINGEIIYHCRLLNKVKEVKKLAEDFDSNKGAIAVKLAKLFPPFLLFHIRATHFLRNNDLIDKKKTLVEEAELKRLGKDSIISLIDILEKIEISLSANAAVYIPAERIIANIIKQSLANLMLNEVPIPKHILSFAAELEKSNTKSIDLSFIQENLKYKIEDGNDKIQIGDGIAIALESAASGIQSVIPILLFADKMRSNDHKSFVIEEPELNLFPSAQYRLIELIESIRHDPSMYGWEDIGIIHTYTTHSPYVLSALNNFLYAHKVITKVSETVRYTDPGRKPIEEKIKKTVNKIVKAVIDPKSFTAYQIKNGHAELIFDDKTGLISDNFIDASTDEINDDFDKLMELEND